ASDGREHDLLLEAPSSKSRAQWLDALSGAIRRCALQHVGATGNIPPSPPPKLEKPSSPPLSPRTAPGPPNGESLERGNAQSSPPGEGIDAGNTTHEELGPEIENPWLPQAGANDPRESYFTTFPRQNNPLWVNQRESDPQSSSPDPGSPWSDGANRPIPEDVSPGTDQLGAFPGFASRENPLFVQIPEPLEGVSTVSSSHLSSGSAATGMTAETGATATPDSRRVRGVTGSFLIGAHHSSVQGGEEGFREDDAQGEHAVDLEEVTSVLSSAAGSMLVVGGALAGVTTLQAENSALQELSTAAQEPVAPAEAARYLRGPASFMEGGDFASAWDEVYRDLTTENQSGNSGWVQALASNWEKAEPPRPPASPQPASPPLHLAGLQAEEAEGETEGWFGDFFRPVDEMTLSPRSDMSGSLVQIEPDLRGFCTTATGRVGDALLEREMHTVETPAMAMVPGMPITVANGVLEPEATRLGGGAGDAHGPQPTWGQLQQAEAFMLQQAYLLRSLLMLPPPAPDPVPVSAPPALPAPRRQAATSPAKNGKRSPYHAPLQHPVPAALAASSKPTSPPPPPPNPALLSGLSLNANPVAAGEPRALVTSQSSLLEQAAALYPSSLHPPVYADMVTAGGMYGQPPTLPVHNALSTMTLGTIAPRVLFPPVFASVGGVLPPAPGGGPRAPPGLPKGHVKVDGKPMPVKDGLQVLLRDASLAAESRDPAVANFLEAFEESLEELVNMVNHFPKLVQQFALDPLKAYALMEVWEENYLSKLTPEELTQCRAGIASFDVTHYTDEEEAAAQATGKYKLVLKKREEKADRVAEASRRKSVQQELFEAVSKRVVIEAVVPSAVTELKTMKKGKINKLRKSMKIAATTAPEELGTDQGSEGDPVSKPRPRSQTVPSLSADCLRMAAETIDQEPPE
ncbi:hypothetical protein CYMTET_31734, partial [Cymbomonas tetramitiformis]